MGTPALSQFLKKGNRKSGRSVWWSAPPICLRSHILIDHVANGVRRLPAHLLSGVGVGVQREACAVVAQRVGERLHIHAVLEGQRGEGMPLWHNKDKSDKPLRRNGLIGLSLFFFQ